MKNITGKFTKDCIIYTDNVEDEAMSIIYNICNHPAFEGQTIRIMPDVHAGKGIVVGFTTTIGKFVNPSHIGVDIGCSMTLIRLSRKLPEDKYAIVEHRIKESIPIGFDIHTKPVSKDTEKKLHAFINKRYSAARASWGEMIPDVGSIDEKFFQKMLKRINMEPKVFYKSIGTLGGGNHFLEYGEDDGKYDTGYFTIHCGSRNFGVKVCEYWKNIAQNTSEASPYNGYLTGEELQSYLSDMVIAQAYALFNHQTIAAKVTEIFSKFGCKPVEEIVSSHNYIDFGDMILRKGAIRSYEGKKIIIPFNMRDGLAVCEGKSNDEWNCSAPHGAGRIMSRNQAKNSITLEDYQESMKGIYSTSVCAGTIDESPMAYKPMNEIISLITPTAEILYMVRPKINIKAFEN